MPLLNKTYPIFIYVGKKKSEFEIIEYSRVCHTSNTVRRGIWELEKNHANYTQGQKALNAWYPREINETKTELYFSKVFYAYASQVRYRDLNIGNN